jgi:glucose/arabinose dehydrogenase
MKFFSRLARASTAVFVLWSWGGTPALAQGLALEPELLVSGVDRTTVMTHAGDGSGRLFIVQQTGSILIWAEGQLLPQPFLDIGALVSCCGERGLLGLAFHPDYSSNGSFYVVYTDVTPNENDVWDVLLARYQVSSDPDLADASSGTLLMRIEQPFGNHNGGNIAFGPDGYLYSSSGDGGSQFDPDGRGQSLDTRLAKLLRIDVDQTDPGREFAIPPTNPFASDSPAGCSESCVTPPCGQTCDEIWALGLRNPWRFSFDRATGDLYLGDVGQATWEEIDRQPAASPGGENYGWNNMEGMHCFEPETDCNDGSLTLPILEYNHDLGCSVTGGYVYRGSEQPQLDGVYLFGDWCSGTVWGTVPRCDNVDEAQVLAETSFGIAAFGEAEDGELLVTEYESSGGAIHRLRLAESSGGPALRIDPERIDFGQLPAGTPASIEVLLTNENLGPEALKIADLSLADSDHFTLDETGGSAPCGTLLPCLSPGESCTVEVSFEASGEAWFLDQLWAPGNSVLTGTAVGACTASAVVNLQDVNVSADETFDACDSLTVDGLHVESGATATLRAGVRITFFDGAVIEGGLAAAAGLP